jgi:hypothetical protein
MVCQGLARWTGAIEGASTWEDLDDLHRRFPGAPARAQLQVLDRRKKKTNLKTIRQVLVHSLHIGQGDMGGTHRLRPRYPEAPPWGQARFQAEGIVDDTSTILLPLSLLFQIHPA